MFSTVVFEVAGGVGAGVLPDNDLPLEETASVCGGSFTCFELRELDATFVEESVRGVLFFGFDLGCSSAGRGAGFLLLELLLLACCFSVVAFRSRSFRYCVLFERGGE